MEYPLAEQQKALPEFLVIEFGKLDHGRFYLPGRPRVTRNSLKPEINGKVS